MKFLITGANGFLGKRLFDLLGKSHQAFGLDVTSGNPLIESIDITDIKNLKKYFVNTQPDVVLHTAAVSSVPACEKDPKFAQLVNLEGSRNVASIALEMSAKCIFTSSLNVYEGTKGNYSEKDEAHPINVYGKTKLEAERIMLETSSKNIVLRVGTLYGYNGTVQGSPTKEVSMANNQENIVGFTDAIRNFTWIDDFPEALTTLIEKSGGGVYNFASYETHSDYHFEQILLEVFGLNTTLLKPKKSPPYVSKNATMNCNKIKSLGIKMTPLGHGLREIRSQMFPVLA